MNSLPDRLKRLAKWNHRYGVGCGEMENDRLMPLIHQLIQCVEALGRACYRHHLDCEKGRCYLMCPVHIKNEALAALEDACAKMEKL